VRETGLGERPLGVAVVVGDPHPRPVAVREAGVREQTDPGLLRCLDGGAVLGGPPAELGARDQQDDIGAVEGSPQRLPVLVVGPPGLHPAIGEIRDPGQVATRRDDVTGGHPPLQQGLHHVVPVGACGAGDHECHG
jgi:hypothetical protein